MSEVIDAAVVATGGVVQAMMGLLRTGGAEPSGPTAGPSPSGAADASPLAYVEVVVTLPASVGERLDPAGVDDVRAEFVRAAEDGGAERASSILLVNPGEITPRVSVLALADGPFSPDDRVAAAEIGEALEERAGGFVLVHPVVVADVSDLPTATLTSRPVTRRIDAMLALSGEGQR